MSNSVVISADFQSKWQELVSQELMAGETIVWAGSPSAEIIEDNTSVIVNLFYFLALGAFIYYIILPFREDGGFSFGYLLEVLSQFEGESVPFLFILLLSPFIYFVRRAESAQRNPEALTDALYLVTNYRALTFTNAPHHVIVDRFLKDESEGKKIDRDLGRIIFRDGFIEVGVQGRSSKDRVRLGFFGIDSFKEVLIALRNVEEIIPNNMELDLDSEPILMEIDQDMKRSNVMPGHKKISLTERHLASRRTVYRSGTLGDVLIWTETSPEIATMGRDWRGVRWIEDIVSAELAIKSVLGSLPT